MAVTPQKPLHDSIAAGLAVQKAHAFDAKESFATLKSMLLKVGFWFHLQGLLIFGSLEVLACWYIISEVVSDDEVIGQNRHNLKI